MAKPIPKQSIKPHHQAQVLFILDLLREGMSRQFILQRFSKKFKNVGVRPFDDRLKYAKKSLEAEQLKIKDLVDVEVQKEIESRKLKIMDSIERKVILSEIARGELKISQTLVAGKDIVEVNREADYSDRKNAIAELNKMDGDYAPTKIENKHELVEPITGMQIVSKGNTEKKK